MATSESTKKPSKVEKLFSIYDQRFEEIRSTDVSQLSSGNIEEYCKELEKEMETLDSKKASILSMVQKASIRDRYTVLIRMFRDLQKFENKIKELLNDTNKKPSETQMRERILRLNRQT